MWWYRVTGPCLVCFVYKAVVFLDMAPVRVSDCADLEIYLSSFSGGLRLTRVGFP